MYGHHCKSFRKEKKVIWNFLNRLFFFFFCRFSFISIWYYSYKVRASSVKRAMYFLFKKKKIPPRKFPSHFPTNSFRRKFLTKFLQKYIFYGTFPINIFDRKTVKNVCFLRIFDTFRCWKTEFFLYNVWRFVTLELTDRNYPLW